MKKLKLISVLGNIKIFSWLPRKLAQLYREGSVVRIRRGRAKGMLWKRYKRYVNGYWLGIYEFEIQERIAQELKSGDIFFDIGANAGFFSLIAGKIAGKSGRVYSFEPLPMNFSAIQEQFKLNNLNQCKPFNLALGNKNGNSLFILPKTLKGKPNTFTARLAHINTSNEETNEKIEVQTVTLDSFIKKQKTVPHIIKIDIEGAEVEMLEGAKNLLSSQNAPKLIIETHSHDIAKKVEKILRKAKYQFFDIKGNIKSDCLFDRHILAYPSQIKIKPVIFK
ncbi:MAG: FkbM family methyltransferase [Spirochaetia bacterium]|nr:FkbM family methyltransferase [Spirochaetia bacterium]